MDWLSFFAGFGACLGIELLAAAIGFALATKAAKDLGDWPEVNERKGVYPASTTNNEITSRCESPSVTANRPKG